ncbi:hypothetical protein MHYP_G00179930 [Metynnis hypsauchen]
MSGVYLDGVLNIIKRQPAAARFSLQQLGRRTEARSRCLEEWEEPRVHAHPHPSLELNGDLLNPDFTVSQ